MSFCQVPFYWMSHGLIWYHWGLIWFCHLLPAIYSSEYCFVECHHAKCLYTNCRDACDGTFQVSFASAISYLPFIMQNIVCWMSLCQVSLYWMSWLLQWYLWAWVCFCHLQLAICNAEYCLLIVIMPSVLILNVAMPAMIPLRLGLLLSFAICHL